MAGHLKGKRHERVHEGWAMISELEDLEKKLKELDDKLAEVNKRMPAHSVKPPIMRQLFELEDERDALVEQIENLKKQGNQNWDDV
jgi:chromosome segregation ATPase